MLRAEFPSLLFLIPGVGAQGGGLETLRFAFRDDGMGALVNVSRGVLFAYRESGNLDGRGFERLVRTKSIDYRERLRELQR
jgi:orotidine-5'-phosphate decarboxylase